jgi:hypothetical protein
VISAKTERQATRPVTGVILSVGAFQPERRISCTSES